MDRFIEKLKVLFDLDKYDEVIKECMDNIYKKDRDKESIYAYLILSFLNKKDYKKADEFCKDALGEFPSSSVFYYYHSKTILYGFKSKEEAKEQILKALSLSPQTAIYHGQLCRVLAEQNRFVEAKEAINRALELDSTDLDLHIANAFCIYYLDGESVAKKIIDEVLAKDPHHEMALDIKQSLFTSKLKQKKSILKELLLKNPFKKSYQKDLKFIQFYYRYIPALMLLTIGLSYVLNSQRAQFGFLETPSMILFLIVAIIGSHDWRLNIPFIAVLYGINIHFTNLGGIEISDVLAIVFLAPIFSYAMYAGFFLFKGIKIEFIKKVQEVKNPVSYFLVTYPFEKNGRLDKQALKSFYVYTTLLMLGSLCIFYMYPELKEQFGFLKYALIAMFFVIATLGAKNFGMNLIYIFVTLIVIKPSNAQDLGITLIAALFASVIFLTIKNLIRKKERKKS